MHVISELRLDDVIEREFILDDIPGLLWSPVVAPPTMPIVLLGHPGGLSTMYPRLLARARRCAADGYAAVTIELPGSGERPCRPDLDQARVDLRRALAAGESIEDIVDRLILPLVELAVPEWQRTLDALLERADLREPVGYSGGVLAIGVRLAAIEPRLGAVGLFAGSFVPVATYDDARRMMIPAHVLLQWDDEANDRDAALRLFDAIGSAQKTLQANMGGHTGVPAFAGEDAARFFARHLG